MATPKTITIDDLSKNEKLTITRFAELGIQYLQIEKRYLYLDALGDPITVLGGGRVVSTAAVADVPANILSALQTINDFMYDQALIQEGME